MNPARPRPYSRPAAVLFVGLAAAVLYFSLSPSSAPPGLSHIDKVQHFLAYFSLAALGIAAWGRRSTAMLAGVLAYGVLIEGLQMALPTGRTASLLDVLANTAGASLAWLGWRWSAARRGRP